MSVIRSSISSSSPEFQANTRAYEAMIEKLHERRRAALAGGTQKARDRHEQAGKLLPRDRVEALLDPGSPFLEIAELAGDGIYDGVPPGAAMIAGIGQVSGRSCMLIANDAPVKGGTYYGMTARKHVRAQQIAWQYRLPNITLVDSGGANLAEQASIFPDARHYTSVFYQIIRQSAECIPQIACVHGACTAGGAYVPALCDTTVIVRGQGYMFLGGPELTFAATGEKIDRESLGGAEMHSRVSGVTDYLAENDWHALAQIREIGESVVVGGADAKDSYLNTDAVIETARKTGAQAVHPGIGFLSEDPEFARMVEAAGLVFIGPTPDTLERLGDKSSAKQEAAACGIPVIDGSAQASADAAEVARMVRSSELPVLLKAVGGGGGRGVSVISSIDQPDEEIACAMRIAGGAFGRPDLLVERFIDRARHIEVQIAGDGRGEVIHLHERECSLQRRYQKVIEEGPAPSLDEVLRRQILDAACALAARLSYRGLGTIEFLVRDGRFYFLEANPRLQVEHPVTELITGLDLVEMQFAIAAEGVLPLTQDAVSCSGHAVEARVYAEDPANDSVPMTGVLGRLSFPAEDVRVDSGVDTGSVVTAHYDPLIAKLIAHGHDRGQALDRLDVALKRSVILGVTTNVCFIRALLGHGAVRAGVVDNGFIDAEFAHWQPDNGGVSTPTLAAAGAVWMLDRRRSGMEDPWESRELTGWRYGDGIDEVTNKPSLYLESAGKSCPIAFSPLGRNGDSRWPLAARP